MDSLRLPEWRKKKGGMTEDKRVMVDTGYFAGQNSGMTRECERGGGFRIAYGFRNDGVKGDGVFFACVKVLFMILY